MKVMVGGEARLIADPDGAVYAATSFGHAFWERYLNVFDAVTVLARVETRDDVGGLLRVDGPGVEVCALPHYVGPEQYLRSRRSFDSAVAAALADWAGAVVLRCPGNLARVAMRHLRPEQSFGVEVVGDPMEVFAKGVLSHPLRPVLRRLAVRDLRAACARAATVAYVSRYALPQRYPPTTKYTYTYSSVSLPPAAFADAPREYSGGVPSRLISIGSMDQLYKGFDVLVEAVMALRARHPLLSLTLVGDGRFRPQLQAEVDRRGLGEVVTFTGNLADPVAVRRQLDSADLYVSASRTEGLPRVVIEAMARGLPAVGTDVGATGELLPVSARCRPGDAGALAELVERHLDGPTATSLARALWGAASAYSAEATQRERDAMFSQLAAMTETGAAR